MSKVCKFFLIFLAATAASGCITVKNPFQSPGADARDLDAGRVARARAAGAGRDERELLLRALETLAQTRRIGHAAALNRTPGAGVVFDYVYFDHDLQEMIKAVREYLSARDNGARAPRATPPLKLDYTR